MIRNNVKLALRMFARSRSYATTTTFGLSFGLAIAMLILLFVRFELSFEADNPLADRIVRLTMDYLNGDAVIDQDAETYQPMGPRVLSEFKQVEEFARAYPINNATIGVGSEFLREQKLLAVDPSFLTLFDCYLLAGDRASALTKPYEAIVTEETALKYFGRTDVLNEDISISHFNQPFKITGLLKDARPNTHIKYNVLISHNTINAAFGEEGYLWDNNNAYTYVLLSDKSRYQDFANQLTLFNDNLHAEGKILNERVIAQPIKDIHLYSHKSFELEQNGDAVSVFFLLGVGALVVIIAVVNHINLSTARSLDRAKEVSVRKIIGSSMNQLRTQFLTESLLINFLSVGVACGLVVIFLPSFEQLSGLPANFHNWSDLTFYLLILCIVLLTTFLSSIFPAFIIAALPPIKALKGKFSRSAGGIRLRKILVTAQFSITIFLLILAITAERQLAYMRAKDLGLDIERTIVVRSPSNQKSENYQVFKDKLRSNSQLESVALSSCVPGQPTSEMASTNVGVNLVGGSKTESFNFYISFIDADFLSTMKIDLAAGEDFLAGDNSQDKILVNEEAIRLWHLPDAKTTIGQKIELWGAQRTIVGVIENFHQASPKSGYLPMIFFHREGGNKLASVRIASGDVRKNVEFIKQTYQDLFPGSPFEFFFLDEEFDKQYRTDEQFGQVVGILTLFAIFISVLGLFGLVSVTVNNRTKEIGIRKALGAASSEIVRLISKDFIELVAISVVISTSLSFFIIQQWLDRYAFRIDLSVWLFAVPAFLVFVLSIVTISARVLGVSRANPVASLKEE